jgi:hypothetical protein
VLREVVFDACAAAHSGFSGSSIGSMPEGGTGRPIA